MPECTIIQWYRPPLIARLADSEECPAPFRHRWTPFQRTVPAIMPECAAAPATYQQSGLFAAPLHLVHMPISEPAAIEQSP